MMGDGFSTDPSRVSHVVIVICFSFFAIVAVIFRFWARRVQRVRWELNDYLCIAGLIFALALSIFTAHSQISWDLGGDPTQIGNPQAILALVILQVKSVIVGEVLWTASVFFIRASVLQLYIHLFRSTKSFRITCYVAHAINFAFLATVVLAACLICRPIAYNWDSTILGGTCGDQKSLDIFIGVFNLLMDVAIVILPMPILWGLQLATSRKVVLSGMFGMGIIICIITLIRIWVTTLNHGTSNAQKIYSMIALLTCLEALLGVINCCLPVMKPVFTKFSDSKIVSIFSNTFPSFSTSAHRRSSHGAATSSTGNPSSRKHYRMKNGTIAGVFGNNEEMQAWPSAVSTTPGSRDTNMHRFVENKAAQIMFGHATAGVTTSKPGSPAPDVSSLPRPPPKSKYYQPEKNSGDKGELEIVVRRDWDVERGERPASDETERNLLEDEKNVKPW